MKTCWINDLVSYLTEASQTVLLLSHKSRREHFLSVKCTGKQNVLLINIGWESTLKGELLSTLRSFIIRNRNVTASLCSSLLNPPPQKNFRLLCLAMLKSSWLLQQPLSLNGFRHDYNASWVSLCLPFLSLFFLFVVVVAANWKKLKPILRCTVYQANDSLRQIPVGLTLHFGDILVQW